MGIRRAVGTWIMRRLGGGDSERRLAILTADPLLKKAINEGLLSQGDRMAAVEFVHGKVDHVTLLGKEFSAHP